MRCPGLDVLAGKWFACRARIRVSFSARASWTRSRAALDADEIELVLIDGPLSARCSSGNLEKAWGVKLLDRTGLILEIFRRPRRHPRRCAAGGAGSAVLPAHAAGAGLDPLGTPARRAWLCWWSGRNSDRGRPPRHRRADDPAAPPVGQGCQDPRAAPRITAQGAVSGGRARGLYQRRKIHAVQPPDRGAT